MPKQVRVKVTSSNKVVNLNENHALRLVQADPKEYQILEPIKYEKIVIPELKKKEVAVPEPQPPVDKPEAVVEEPILDTPKRGRPKKQTA